MTTSASATRGVWLTGGQGIYVGATAVNNPDGGSFISANLISIRGDTGVFAFGTTTAPQAVNTGLSKTAAAEVAIGNGTAGNSTGGLRANYVTLSGNINLPQAGSRVNFLANATAIGNLDIYRTGEATPIMSIEQYSTAIGARRVSARGEGFQAYTDAGQPQACISQYGIRAAQGIPYEFSSVVNNITTIAARIQRNATTATIDFLNAAGFRFRNFADTAFAPIYSGFVSLTANPTTLDITSGAVADVKNTTSGELRRWVNDGGTMKSILYA